MPPQPKRMRRPSVASKPGRSTASRRSTPLASFKRPSLVPNSQRQRNGRATIIRQDDTSRAQSTLPDTALPNAIPSSTPGASRAVSTGEDDDSLEHIILAIDVKERDKVGCACYIAREERLLCMEDVIGGGQEAIDHLQVDLQPTIVLVSTRVEAMSCETDPQRKTRQGSLIDNENERRPLPYHLDIRPPAEFSYDGAKQKLVNSHFFLSTAAETTLLVPGESTNFQGIAEDIGLTDRQGRLLQVSAWYNMENKVSIGCVGAVITYLQRKRASEYLQDDPAGLLAYRIATVDIFTLRDVMLINADTLSSLQIIQPESHPNAFNQGPGTSGSKESLSIYGLFRHLARTPQGKARLRQYFLRPSLDLKVINQRLDFVAVCSRPDNHASCQKLAKSMSRIKNMRTTMTLLHKGVNGGNRKLGGFKSGVWASLLEFCYHTIDVADALGELVGGDHLPLKARGIDMLERFQLQKIGKMIHEVVDLDLSVEQHRTVVKYGVSEDLDRIKEMYDGMDDLLSKAARQIAETIPGDLNLNVIYFPQLGFHITIPIDEATNPAVYSGSSTPWERMFTTKNQVYFKDTRMRELDEQLGDLYAMICDSEIEISYDLAQRVLLDEVFLVRASEVCGEIDSLLALAQGATQYKLVRPKMTEENLVAIKGCRHLLQEMTVPSYVPNDAHLIGGEGSLHSSTITSASAATGSQSNGPTVLLLTGPNYSGKSVYQKQVALAVYMAHVGSFVAAECATVGLTDKILTRITTCETVSKTQSAFMIDLQQIALAVNHCSRRSLVVIDEFGKGTDSCDGAGLAAGVFQHFLSLGAECPKILAATHFHEIFEPCFLGARDDLAFAHMEVRVDRKGKRTAGDHNSEVVYLYNLQEGCSSLSYGTQCAAMNGIPPQVITRAADLADRTMRGEDLVAVCAGLSDEDADDLEHAEIIARQFLSFDINKANGVRMLTEMLGSVLGEGTEETTGALGSSTQSCS